MIVELKDLIEQITAIAKDDNSDDFIALLENVTDTLQQKFDNDDDKPDNDDDKPDNDISNLQTKIADLTKQIEKTEMYWKKKYKERFYDCSNDNDMNDNDKNDNDKNDNDNSPINFDDLFKKEEK